MRRIVAIACAGVSLLALACGGDGKEPFRPGPTVDPSVTPATLTVTSEAITPGEEIPERFHCGEAGDREHNTSPPVSWTAGPEGTESYVLLMREFDSPLGNLFHWAVANLPASVTSIDEGAASKLEIRGGTQVRNNYGVPGYSGPCPAVVARTRDMRIEVFALNSKIDLTVLAGRVDAGHVTARMAPHILATGSLRITYNR